MLLSSAGGRPSWEIPFVISFWSSVSEMIVPAGGSGSVTIIPKLPRPICWEAVAYCASTSIHGLWVMVEK